MLALEVFRGLAPRDPVTPWSSTVAAAAFAPELQRNVAATFPAHVGGSAAKRHHVTAPPNATAFDYSFSAGASSGDDGYPYPARWLRWHSREELDASRTKATSWADAAKEATRHAWKGYREKAWGHDQLHPVKGTPDNWFNLGLNIVETLDTLWLMGLREEFDEAERWVEQSLNFENANTKLDSFFEATIRILGGLLGAHSMSGRPIFLTRARELGDRLISAWPLHGDFPNSEVNIAGNTSKHTSPQPGEKDVFGTAEVGTCQLEFRYLSRHTGDPIYAMFADRAFNAIMDASPNKGLVSIYLKGNRRHAREFGSVISMGARGDSYYEYLLKQYLQTSQTEPKFLERWMLAMQEMMDRLIWVSPEDGHLYVAKETDGRPIHEFDHLSCFVAGMLVQGVFELPQGTVPESWKDTAAGITRTCRSMYDTTSGLAPEIVDFSSNHKSIKTADSFSLLRPEAVEAMYYMWYYTGDHKYREWAHFVLEGINRSARTRYGFSAMDGVDAGEGQGRKRDSCESFFFAETLKYLYLIQADVDLVPLDQFVFNTEAHPLRIWRPGDAVEHSA